jgi:acetylornithine deacetylase/succinyl-diaminopimelate desuccinylase-like protein
MHAEDEHVIITSLARRAALLAAILKYWQMEGEEPPDTMND